MPDEEKPKGAGYLAWLAAAALMLGLVWVQWQKPIERFVAYALARLRPPAEQPSEPMAPSPSAPNPVEPVEPPAPAAVPSGGSLELVSGGDMLESGDADPGAGSAPSQQEAPQKQQAARTQKPPPARTQRLKSGQGVSFTQSDGR